MLSTVLRIPARVVNVFASVLQSCYGPLEEAQNNAVGSYPCIRSSLQVLCNYTSVDCKQLQHTAAQLNRAYA